MEEEVYRSAQVDVTLIHRVMRDDNGKYHVEFPVVDGDGNIEEWSYVGGSPGLPSPTYDTLAEAIAFIDGLENGLQGLNFERNFEDEKEQSAYDEGLKFGLEL
jgi:hypothetical protein